jgi:hypothetical protein
MKDWIIELCPEIADWQAELIDEAVAARIADEREASLDAVLQVIKELRPALVLAAFADKDNAWVLDKVKESIEKLKEKPNDPRPNKRL